MEFGLLLELWEGEKEIKFHGKFYPVNANILSIEGLSAHGDQNDLLNWISELEKPPTKTFLIHGENSALDALRIKISERYNYECQIPVLNQVIEI